MTKRMKKEYARFIRGANAGTLSESVEKMKKVSRITNVIYLQQGLIDGSILPDVLLTEILKLGTAESSVLIATDSTKLKADVESLKTLAQSIKLTQEMKDNLEHFLGLDDIRKSVEGLGDVASWSSENTVTDITKDFKDNELSLPLIDNILGYVSVIVKGVEELSNINDLGTRGKVANAHGPFVNIGEDGQNLIDETKTLTPDHSDFKSISDIQSLMSLLSVIFKAVDGIVEFSKHTKTILGNDGAKQKNFENFKTVSSYSAGSQDLKTVSQLYQNRQNRKSMDMKYSFPFMDSGRNIIELANDISDPWIKTVTKSAGFPESLNKLSSLGGSLKTINEVLTLSKQEAGLEMTTFMEIVDQILSITFDQSQAKDISESFTTCGSKLAKPMIQLDDIKELQKDSIIFDKTVDDLKKASSEMLEIIRDEEFLKMLNDIVVISNKWDDDDTNVSNQVFEEFKKYANLEKFTSDLKRLKDLSVKIDPLRKALKKSAGDVHKNIDKIGTFQTAYAPFADGFDCLIQMKSSKPLIEMISLTQKVITLAAMKQGFVQVEKYIGRVSGAIPDIKKVKNELDAMKGKNTLATDALNILPDREIHSRTIGSATQGIVNMATALEKKTEFEGLISEMSLVSDQVKIVTLDPKDVKILEELVSIGPLLATMYQSLDAWESSLEDSNSAKLADHAGIFLNAKTVSEVVSDFDESLKSLGKLISHVTDPGVKDKLKNVQQILEKMDSSGLKFSDFSKSFDDSKTTLNSLDTFFANYGKRAPSSGGWTTNILKSIETTTIAVLSSSTASSSALLIVLYVGLLVGLVLLVFFLVFWILRKRKRNKNKEKSKKLSEKEKKEIKKFEKRIKPFKPPNRTIEMADEFQLDKTQPLEDPNVEATAGQKPTKPPLSKDKIQPRQDKQSSIRKLIKSLKSYSLKSTQSLQSWFEVSARSYKIDKDVLETLCGRVNTELHFEQERLEKKHIEDLKENENAENPNHNKNFVEDYFFEAVNSIITRTNVECKDQTDAECVKLNEYQKTKNVKMGEAYKITYPNKLQMIVAKSPRRDSKKKEIAGELEKFWCMVQQENVKEIYMLSGFVENGVSICGEYFPQEPGTTVTCGQYVIECTSKRMEVSDSVVCRTLVVNHGETSCSVEHHQHEPKMKRTVHGKNTVALNPYTYSALLRKAHKSQGPIIVHCQNGISRSAVFAYTELLLQQVQKKKGNICFTKVLKELRSQLPRELELLTCGFSILTMLVYLYGDATCSLIEFLINAYETKTKVHDDNARFLRERQEAIDKELREEEERERIRLEKYRELLKTPKKQKERAEHERQGWVFEKDGYRATRVVKDALGNDQNESYNDDWSI